MAGTFAFNPKSPRAGLVPNSITCSWTSDGSGNASITTEFINGVLLRGTTDPGSPAPTDNYDITIADANGVTLYTDSSRDTANSETFYFIDTTTGFPPAVVGPLTITIANAGASKAGSVVIYFR